MSERQSILRLKVVGFENTKSAVADLQKEIMRIATVAMPRQDKIIGQQILGGFDPKAAVATWNAMVVRQQQMIGSLTQLSLHENAQIARAKELLRLKTDILQRSQGLTTAGRGGTSADTIQQGAFGALTAMGSRRILRQGAGMVAQQMMNTPGIGQEVGLALGGFLYGGPVLGTIAAVGSATAAYFRDANEGAKKAQETTKAFADELMRAASEAAKMAGAFAPITSFGKTAQGEVEKARESSIGLSREGLERSPSGTTGRVWHNLQQAAEAVTSRHKDESVLQQWWGAMKGERGLEFMAELDRAQSGGTPNTAESRAGDVRGRQKAYQERIIASGAADVSESKRRARENLRINSGLELGTLAIGAQRPTPERERKLLENQIKIQRVKREQAHEEERIEINAEARKARMAVDAAETEVEKQTVANGYSQAQEIAAANVLKMAKDRRKEAEESQLERPVWQDEEKKQDARVAAGGKGKLEADISRHTEDIAKQRDQEIALNKIQLDKKGFEQQRASIAQQFKFEIDKAEKAGETKDNIDKIKSNRRLKLAVFDKQYGAGGKEITDTLLGLEEQRKLATREATQEEIQWLRMSRQAYDEYGNSGKKNVEKLKAAFDLLTGDKKKTELADIATSQKISLEMIQGTKDPYEAKREELRRQKKTPEQIDTIIEGQMGVDSAAFIKQERMKKNPKMQLDEYVKSLDQALKLGPAKGGITKEEYDRRKMDKAQELLGPKVGGQFMDAMSYVRHTQTALLSDANIPKEMRDALQAIEKAITDMNRMGIPWRG